MPSLNLSKSTKKIQFKDLKLDKSPIKSTSGFSNTNRKAMHSKKELGVEFVIKQFHRQAFR